MVPATLPVLRYPSNLVPFSTLPPSTRPVFQTRMASRRHLRPPSNLHCANLRQGRLQYASSPFANTRDITLLWHVLRCSTRQDAEKFLSWRFLVPPSAYSPPRSRRLGLACAKHLPRTEQTPLA
ncbi:hypothetical protein L210DRAFT_3086889 [Boletus edulis BED1]|uniref:Uncharacterized protein n=1 Tax=Boletus edulis BED1 TaxID=1328754 RepID=A0AAD4G8T1_BOLED|nr:hypothetical protein L210DRAFT_3086889 [Boletus edulis BED1]